MIFYHVCPRTCLDFDTLFLSRRGYICLASSIEQAIYWTHVLYGKESERPYTVSDCVVLIVDVPDKEIVEDCIGHYAFEYEGEKKMAKEVKSHPVDDLDGEVVVRSPVKIIGELDIDLLVEVARLEKEQARRLKEERRAYYLNSRRGLFG